MSDTGELKCQKCGYTSGVSEYTFYVGRKTGESGWMPEGNGLAKTTSYSMMPNRVFAHVCSMCISGKRMVSLGWGMGLLIAGSLGIWWAAAEKSKGGGLFGMMVCCFGLIVITFGFEGREELGDRIAIEIGSAHYKKQGWTDFFSRKSCKTLNLPVGTEAGAGALHEAPKGASFSKKPAPPPRQTTRCQKCGGEISVGAKTCMHCWEKL